MAARVILCYVFITLKVWKGSILRSWGFAKFDNVLNPNRIQAWKTDCLNLKQARWVQGTCYTSIFVSLPVLACESTYSSSLHLLLRIKPKVWVLLVEKTGSKSQAPHLYFLVCLDTSLCRQLKSFMWWCLVIRSLGQKASCQAGLEVRNCFTGRLDLITESRPFRAMCLMQVRSLLAFV